ncbi:MAG: Sua5 family C-terminal domain-containing protein, partial [Paraclostridium bifermentans]
IDPSIEGKADVKKAKAPGMKYTHYSPNGDVFIVRGEDLKVINKINSLIDENEEKGLRCGVMCLNKNKENYKGEVIGLGDNLEEVGSNLFNALIEMDKKEMDIIYSEAFSNHGVGRAIMNRLMKSAGYKIIEL